MWVVQTGVALGSPAVYPLVGRCAGDAHLVSHVRDGATGSDPLDQKSPAVKGQSGVGVGHQFLCRCRSSGPVAASGRRGGEEAQSVVVLYGLQIGAVQSGGEDVMAPGRDRDAPLRHLLANPSDLLKRRQERVRQGSQRRRPPLRDLLAEEPDLLQPLQTLRNGRVSTQLRSLPQLSAGPARPRAHPRRTGTCAETAHHTDGTAGTRLHPFADQSGRVP